MRIEPASRRRFLISSATGLSSIWLQAHWPAILGAATHAHRAAQSGRVMFSFLSASQAAEVDAIAAQIIPSTSSPGAREANVVHFIDRALTSFDREKQGIYIQGLATLQQKVREVFHGTDKFSVLGSQEQIQILTGIEKTEFFEMVRVHTIMGFLAKPTYGGNRDEVGWKAIGFEDRMTYVPPFGYYDAEFQKDSK